MPQPIISDSQMARIRAKFGPNTAEDVAYLLRIDNSPQTGSFRKLRPLSVIGPLGCRVNYVGNLNVREKMQAGQVLTQGDYIINLPSGTVVFTSDLVQVSALPWSSSQSYVNGRKVIPVDLSDKVFIAQSASGFGNSDVTEPDWSVAVSEGDPVTDNDITWHLFGPAPRYEIIQISGPGTYADLFAVRLACNLQQNPRSELI